jgi:glycosyltransferase involved in cell wall biosynthesis
LGDNGSGVQVSVHHLAAALCKMKDVRVYGGAGVGSDANFRAFPISGPAAFGYLPGLGRILDSERLDLLHTHGLWMYTSVACVRWSDRRKPYVVSPHGMLAPWALRISGWKKKLAGTLYENRHLRGAACLHALNAAEAESIRRCGLRNPICIVPNGVDLAPDKPSRGDSSHTRSLLYLGRLHPIKGLPRLIEAWSLVAKEAKESGWQLVIAGWDQNGHGSELRGAVDRLGLSSSVHFAGPQFGADKDATFKKASAFILPSLSEALPMTILEAWAWNLPVLITPECNMPEGSQAGAAIVIEQNVDGMATGLRRLFSMSDSERERIGSNGRKLVESKFQWSCVAEQMAAVYDWILGLGPQPDCVKN